MVIVIARRIPLAIVGPKSSPTLELTLALGTAQVLFDGGDSTRAEPRNDPLAVAMFKAISLGEKYHEEKSRH